MTPNLIAELRQSAVAVRRAKGKFCDGRQAL